MSFLFRLFLVALVVAVFVAGKDTLKMKKKFTHEMGPAAPQPVPPPDVSYSPMKSVRKMVQPPRPRLRLKGKLALVRKQCRLPGRIAKKREELSLY